MSQSRVRRDFFVVPDVVDDAEEVTVGSVERSRQLDEYMSYMLEVIESETYPVQVFVVVVV